MSDLLLLRRNMLAAAIPAGYTRLAGIRFAGNTYYDTGLHIEGSDTIKLSYLATANGYVFGALHSSTASDNINLYHVNGVNQGTVRYGSARVRPTTENNVRYDLTITPTGVIGFDTTYSWTQQTFTASQLLYIGWSPNTSYGKLKGTIYDNVEIVGKANFIPVIRNSDGEIGYYDTYSRTFLVNQGSAAPTPLYN